MFIKKLEIFGFKSFKTKTVLEFNNYQITGIVGPNGCGKSNVVDAFLWVMGESSPKNLRGETLSDVIFGGTNKESPGNLAEVTLILGQGKEGFPESYNKYSEVMITRRAFRDGKNEYLINQQTCLLRDVREFFMNTGAGCRGFSIIEQESIERLITAKPTQRRFIIEEAAGIIKFKSRKIESMRKLDLVNQNLKRISDVLNNQESQLNQLNSQAKKAEKYKKTKKEIEIRKKQMEHSEQEDIFCVYQKLIKEQEVLKVEQQEEHNKEQATKKKIEEETVNIKATEEQIETERQMEIEGRLKEADIKNQIKMFEEIKNTQNKKQELEEQEKIIQAELNQMQGFLKDKSDMESLEKDTVQIENHLQEIQHNKKETEVRIAGLKKQKEFIDREIKFLQEEKNDIQSQIQSHINEKNETHSRLKKSKQKSLMLNNSLTSILEKDNQLESKKKKLEEEFHHLTQQTQVFRHKIEEMEKLISRVQSGNEGALDLIQWRREDFQPLFGKLDVESEYSVAVGFVLGHYIQALIPREDFSIEEAVQRLKNSGKGKTSFLSHLPGLPVSSSLKKEMKNYPALICFLDEKIKWNIHTQPLKPFLEQTAVVSDLSSALKMKKQFPSFQFVTKEGDLITRDSFVYAGSSDKETGLLEIQTQIKDCTNELSNAVTTLKVKSMDLSSCELKYQETQKEKHNVQSESNKNSKDIAFLTKDLELAEKDILRLSTHRQANEKKTAKFEKEKFNLLQHEDACGKEINTISVKKAQLQALQAETEKYKSQHFRKTKCEKELQENFKIQGGLEELCLVHEEQKEMSVRLTSFQKEQEKQANNIKNLHDQIYQIQTSKNNLELEWDKKELKKNHLKDKFLENYQLQIDCFVSTLDEVPLEKLKEEMSHYEKQLERLGGVNFLALEDYEKLSKENFFLSEQKEDLVRSKKEIVKVISHIDKLCETRFSRMLEEINAKFEKIFPLVFQGDNAKARLILHEEPDKEPGVDILIHPPGKRPQSVSLLSRGEKALTSICLIYALFLVKPSPFCIIDEADAPLDDANILRFLSVLQEMSRKSQIIMISHNKHTMQSCQKLYGVTMERPGVSQIVSVDMPKKTLSPSPQTFV